MKRKNIMVFGLARSGSTLLSLILGAHSDVTNFGESHKLIKDRHTGRLKSRNKVYRCKVHGASCEVVENIKTETKYKNHFKTLSKYSETQYFLTTNKHFGHYNEMDYHKFQNKVILIYKPLEVWLGSPLSRRCSGGLKPEEVGLEELISKYINFHSNTLARFDKESPLHDFIFINYMDLATKPRQTVKKICKFLNIKFENDMMKFNSHLLSGGEGQHPIAGNGLTYYNSWEKHSKKDSRYDDDINAIFIEEKYKKYLKGRLLNKVVRSKGYKEIKLKLLRRTI